MQLKFVIDEDWMPCSGVTNYCDFVSVIVTSARVEYAFNAFCLDLLNKQLYPFQKVTEIFLKFLVDHNCKTQFGVPKLSLSCHSYVL